MSRGKIHDGAMAPSCTGPRPPSAILPYFLQCNLYSYPGGPGGPQTTQILAQILILCAQRGKMWRENHFGESGDDPAAASPSKRRTPCKNQVCVLGGGEAKQQEVALWRQGKFCDVKVSVRGETFPAHRLVRAAQSEFLAVLFDGELRDSNSPVVDIGEMEPDIFRFVIEYMFDGNCSIADVSQLEPVLCAASRLRVTSLVTATAAHV